MAITTNSDIGTFVYISRAIGVPLDTVVKWFILVIVLVFDPLSICLVLAYNFLIKREEITVSTESKVEKEEAPVWTVYGESTTAEEPKTEETKIEEPSQSVPSLQEDYFKNHRLFRGT